MSAGAPPHSECMALRFEGFESKRGLLVALETFPGASGEPHVFNPGAFWDDRETFPGASGEPHVFNPVAFWDDQEYHRLRGEG